MRRDDLSWLLGMANDMRARKNDDPLKDLPISVPEDTGACIIANAFNYDCEVDPRTPTDKDPDLVGWINFQTQEDVEAYCKITGIEPPNQAAFDDEGVSNEEDPYRCKLTKELNEVALDFDSGKYDEYNYYTWVEKSDDPEAVAERERTDTLIGI